MTYFSVINPRIPLAGMLTDRKSDIYDIIDSEYVPNTVVYDHNIDTIEQCLKENNIFFPLIVKPNTGVGGNGVFKADSIEELKEFLEKTTIEDLIIQNFIHLKKEFSVLYYCLPKSKQTTVYSVVEKTYPVIVGDGKSTIYALIESLNNGRIRKDYVMKKFAHRQDEVPQKGEEIIIDYIGNFVSGAEFVPHVVKIPNSFGHILYNALTKTGDIHFARLDMKADSVEELLEGKFEIIEVNGAKSEPLEIYSPFIEEKRKKEILKFHWEQMEKIAHEQKELGVKKETLRSAIKSVREIVQKLNEK